MRLAVAGDHPQLHALGDLELVFLREQGPERLSPDCGTFREELADKGAFLLHQMNELGVRAGSRCASDGHPGFIKRSQAATVGIAIVFDVASAENLPRRQSLRQPFVQLPLFFGGRETEQTHTSAAENNEQHR